MGESHQPPLPSETWADLRQLAVGLLLVFPFIAVAAYFARVLIGWHAALWLAVGLGVLAMVTFVLVAGASILANFIVDSATADGAVPRLGEGRTRRDRRPDR